MKSLPTLGLIGLALAAAPAQAEDWNTFFGGIPGGDLLTGEIGYPMVPRAAYHHPLSNKLSIGGAFSFDLGYYAPQGGTDFGMSLTVPIRLAMSDSAQWTTALTFNPGLAFRFNRDFRFGLLLNAAFNAGYKVNNQFTIGPGVDVLLGFNLTPYFQLGLPILLGPALEFHPTQELAITFDLKMGPNISAGDAGSGAHFGLKVAAGIAYHL